MAAQPKASPDMTGKPSTGLLGRIDYLARHPVKGFTPERIEKAQLDPGAPFPCDRLYAVENGPSGFDPKAPGHIAKTKFTVLARMPAVAALRTTFSETTSTFHVQSREGATSSFALETEEGREGLARYLTDALGVDVTGPLQVLKGPGAHRFFDHPQGHISLINLASVRDLEARICRPLDPARFRGNVMVEGWPAWAEMSLVGQEVRLGEVRTSVLKTITRCVATHVDPQTAESDIDVVKALFDNYGHTRLGLYLNVVQGGEVTVGNEVAG
jgi:uncharacterized protein